MMAGLGSKSRTAVARICVSSDCLVWLRRFYGCGRPGCLVLRHDFLHPGDRDDRSSTWALSMPRIQMACEGRTGQRRSARVRADRAAGQGSPRSRTERADVRAAAADDVERQRRPDVLLQFDRVDSDLARFDGDRPGDAGEVVGPIAADVDRAEGRGAPGGSRRGTARERGRPARRSGSQASGKGSGGCSVSWQVLVTPSWTVTW